MAATKCRNCGGPHRSDSRRCLARPTGLVAPTKEQVKTFRQVREREYQAVLRAINTEESAHSAENIKFDLTCSQDLEADGDIDNIPASPIENLTGDAMRLLRATKRVVILSMTLLILCRSTLEGGTTPDIALTRACELKIDVLLIRDPLWSNCTKIHPLIYNYHL